MTNIHSDYSFLNSLNIEELTEISNVFGVQPVSSKIGMIDNLLRKNLDIGYVEEILDELEKNKKKW